MLSSDLVRSVLDSAPDALVLIDSSGTVLFVNEQVAALFQYEPREIIGHDVECLLPERFRKRHVAHRQSYAQNVRVRPMGIGLDLFARRKDGTEFPVEISLSPIIEGDGTLVVAAIRDVSDRRAIEMELKRARAEADRANQAKSRFLATASHDLRQPLQTLALLNGSLRRMVRDPELAEALTHQDLAIGAMSRLLNALLDISKLESGAIRPEPTDFRVAEIFAELRNEFAGLAADKGLRLDVEQCADRVHSDPSLVEQVLRNLVSNAIKYTRQGRVLLRCLHEPACVRVEVLDTGIGIPGDELARIYDEFYQVGVRTNTSRDGYGLGLSIVQRIVQLLGLRLDVHSVVGEGSTFSLALPVSTNRRAAVHASAETRADTPAQEQPATPRILLVEDDPAVRNATRLLLKVSGYQVTVAGTSGEAVERAGEGDFDLLITDYHLAAGETGDQVISAVREVLRPDLKSILITGDTSSAVRDLDRDDRLRVASKPIDADQLLALVRAFLAA